MSTYLPLHLATRYASVITPGDGYSRPNSTPGAKQRRQFLKNSALVVIAAMVVSCGGATETPPAERIDVYYIPFLSTWITALSAEDVVRGSDYHLIIQDPDQRSQLMSAPDGACTVSKSSEKPQDLRLVIRSQGKPGWSWEASAFEYQDSRSNVMCILTPARRAGLLSILGLEE